MNAYKLAGHQHVCEVERELSLLSDHQVKVTFTAHVVPVCRGILSTLYGNLRRECDAAEALDLYRAFYAEDAFVRVMDAGAAVGTMQVRATNTCVLVVSVDARTKRLRVVSLIDNLVKGQAGSALQNMNLLFGLPETSGLDRPGTFP
jgi:N-acetyl-gamma-glutamyl-phosphate reductase